MIAGIAVTDTSYNTAIELLTKIFRKPEEIQCVHINHLLHLPAVLNEKSANRLHILHDHIETMIETHFCGLEATGVDTIIYSSLVVPELVEKIPESIRFNIIRGYEKDFSLWSLDELLAAFGKDLDIRESYLSRGYEKEREQKKEELPARAQTLTEGRR